MDELKRWREERAIRQSLRLLKDYTDPDEMPVAPAVRRFTSGATKDRRAQPSAMAGSRAARNEARRRKLRLWPAPPRVSPVHPEWDDPTGGRFKSAFYRSIGLHLLLIPSLLLFSRIDLTLQEPSFHAGTGRMRVIAVGLTAPPGGGQKRAPVVQPPSKPPETKPKTEAVKSNVAPAKPPAKIAKVQPKPEKTVTRTEGVVPKPVKDSELAQRHTEDVHPLPHKEVVTEEPATDPVAVAGPLLVGAGPVPGSQASVGGIDGVDFPYNYYLERIREMIAQSWQVPQGLVSKGRQLKAVIRFRINRDGSVSDTSVEEPSGFSFFDQAGLRAVSQVRRFPPLPDTFGGGFLVVHFQFAFTGR